MMIESCQWGAGAMIPNQGGYQIREDIKAGEISDAERLAHLLRIPREDVTAKCCI